MAKIFVVVLHCVSLQFHYFSNFLCEISGGGCSIKLKETMINFKSYNIQMDGVEAMLIALAAEIFVFTILSSAIYALIKYNLKPQEQMLIDQI